MNQIGFSVVIQLRSSNRARFTGREYPPKGAFTAQVEVDIEITHGQLSQAAINRLAITAPGEIGFRHCAPMTAHLENRNDMIGILFRFQIEDQRRNPMIRSAAAPKIPPSRHEAERSCRTFFGDRAV